jgi:antitoxin ParD1/3/4
MEKLDISLPEQIQAFIDEQIAVGGYSKEARVYPASEERIAKNRVEMLLVEGIESGEPIEATSQWWEEKRSGLLENNDEANYNNPKSKLRY